MINGPEGVRYPHIYKHINLPWYGLKPYAEDIVKAEAKPLTASQMEDIINSLASKNPKGRPLVQKLHNENRTMFIGTQSIALILDGSSSTSQEGYLGDMIEATRLVEPLRASGKKVVLITPHTDLFQSTIDPNISILPLPADARASHIAPWNPRLLNYLHDAIGNMPCIFPMNAGTPALIQIGKNGTIRNNQTLMTAKDAFSLYERKMSIQPDTWSRYGIHQLQAFQIIAYLIGIERAKSWQEFPSAFLHPSPSAREVALEVVRRYGCFDTSTYGEECPPLYLHPGVATNGSKLTTKFYPEEKWVEVIEELAISDHVANSLTLLEPSDPDQGAMTLRLAREAVEAGLRVSKVPMSFVKQHYEWTLGSFIALLQELAQHRGIVVGCDSMPAGHAGPATGNPSIVLGNFAFDPGFYSPEKSALVVLPYKSKFTSSIRPHTVVDAIQRVCLDPKLQYRY